MASRYAYYFQQKLLPRGKPARCASSGISRPVARTVRGAPGVRAEDEVVHRGLRRQGLARVAELAVEEAPHFRREVEPYEAQAAGGEVSSGASLLLLGSLTDS